MDIRDRKIFAKGGMDTDSSPEFVAPNDVISAFNSRISGTSEGEDGYRTNIESTEPIAGTRPDGINKGIGATAFETIRKAIGFVYNSGQINLITELDYDTGVETILFTNKTDSADTNILPLDPQHYVTDIKLIGGEFIAFTDGNMQPCYINLNRLRDGGYGVLTEDDFLLIKAQILQPPTAVYGNDESRSVNLMSGNMFQFRSQVVYLDNEYSAHSTISKRPVPTSEGTPVIGTDVTKNNNIIVSTRIGSNRGQRVLVSARIGMLDWFTIKDVNRSYITSLTNTTIDTALEIYEAYDPATGIYSFVFYNDGLYNNVAVLETDLIADYVPLKAESLEVLNGNVLALGGITEGYDRPNTPLNFSISTYQPDISIDVPVDTNSFKVDNWYQIRPSGTSYRKVYIYFKGLPKTNDVLTFITGNLDNKPYEPAIVYTVKASLEDNLLGSVQDFAKTLIYPTSTEVLSGGLVLLRVSLRREDDTPDGEREHLLSVTINPVNAGTGASKSVSALKSNSSYQLAFAHYDSKGRPFPIQTDDTYIVKTQSFSQLKGQASVINWEILNANAPVGAVSAQLLLSKNNTHENNLFVVGKVQSSTTQYITLNINALQEFNKGNQASILSYDYTKGDRVTFHYYDDAGVQWFESPSVDVEVIGFEIEVTEDDPPVTNYLLKVRRSTQLEVPDITGKNILIEIYTPRKRTITNSDGEVSLAPTVFYEIGEQIDIVDGVYTRLSGTITEGDSFFKSRQLENAISGTLQNFEVESFHFSDFYESNFSSYGRERSYYDTTEREELKASIRYSDVFRIGSAVNGITRFYKERIYGDGDGETSSDNGWINKIRQRDNYLVCIQELKIGHIPVFQSIIEDQTAQQNVAISDRILGGIRYLQSGKYGMGGCKTSYAESKNGTIYFIDFNNSVPVRDGYNGVMAIPGKMTKFFKRTLQQAKKDRKKIIGWFDNYNEEYVVTIEQSSDVVMEFNFTNGNWRYLESYTINPANIAISVAPTKGTVVFSTMTGIAKYKSFIGETGADGYEFQFTIGGQTYTKRKCWNILPGDTEPFAFSFIDLVDQEISTLVYSNPILVSGVNVPTPISITNGEYEINDIGVWTSANGFVNNDDSVKVRQTTSGDYEETTSAVLTIGGVSDSFDATTEDSPLIGNEYQSANYTKNDCGVNETGTNVTYVVPADTYFEETLEAANALAIAEIEANGQTYANANGVCVANPEFGNVATSGTFRKNDCPSGSSGTFATYTVPANTYTASTQSEANALAQADVDANGQAYANNEEVSGSTCLVNTTGAIITVDMFNDGNLDVCGYIDTPGVAESLQIASTGNNFFLPTDAPANAYILASDNMTGTTKRRFIFNIGKLIAQYPDDVAIPEFIFKIRGRSTLAGSKTGAYQEEYPTETMTMSGSPGTYVPSTAPGGGPAAINWSANVDGGANGTIGIGVGSVILTFTYNRSTNTVSLIGA